MKRTFVTEEQVLEQQERSGFMPVCCYWSIQPDENEIGGIFKNVRNTRLERGLFVHGAECVERIFVGHNG